MELTVKREIVYLEQQHTLMYHQVTVKANEAVLLEMLAEELCEVSKREFIQTLYLCKLNREMVITPDTRYGAWSASIGDIEHVYPHESAIFEKVIGKVTQEEIQKNMIMIDEQILGLSGQQLLDSMEVRSRMHALFDGQ
jgi:hypothetical protein